MNNILFRFEKITDVSFKVLYTVETNDLMNITDGQAHPIR